MKKSPCLNCDDRHPGCHGGCEKYKELVDHKRVIAQNKHKENAARSYDIEKKIALREGKAQK